MAWGLVLTDSSYAPLGEILNASDRQIGLMLNGVDTLGFSVRLDNPLADPLLSTNCYVKAYRNSVLQFYGPVISAQEAADSNGARISVNAAGAAWILSKRLAGKNATGTVFGSATDRAAIVSSLIATTNIDGETGIQTNAANRSGSALTYTAGPYRPIMDILTELASTFDGFDWRFMPIENYSGGVVTGQKISQLNAYPASGGGPGVLGTTIGVDQDNAVFEWGNNTRGNIVAYNRSVSRDTQANKVYHNVSEGPDAPGYPTFSASDPASISAYRLLEALVETDIHDTALRNSLLNAHIAVRKNPRQIIDFTPANGNLVNLPQYGVDYSVGDRVRARAQYNTSVRFDAMMRVWSVTFTIDENGTEQATLKLAQE